MAFSSSLSSMALRTEIKAWRCDRVSRPEIHALAKISSNKVEPYIAPEAVNSTVLLSPGLWQVGAIASLERRDRVRVECAIAIATISDASPSVFLAEEPRSVYII